MEGERVVEEGSSGEMCTFLSILKASCLLSKWMKVPSIFWKTNRTSLNRAPSDTSERAGGREGEREGGREGGRKGEEVRERCRKEVKGGVSEGLSERGRREQGMCSLDGLALRYPLGKTLSLLERRDGSAHASRG